MQEKDNNLNEENIKENDIDENVKENEESINEPGFEKDYQEETPYANEIKMHVPIVIIAFLLLVIVMDSICLIRFPNVVREYKAFRLAEEKVANGETSTAISELSKIAQKHADSKPILIKAVDLSMENGYYDNAGYIIENYLVGKTLDDDDYNKINSYYNKLDNYYNSYDAVNKILQKASSQDKSYELYNEEIKNQLMMLLGQNDLDQAYIYYYLGGMETNIVEARDYLQKCYDMDPECFDVRVQLSVMNRRLGDMQQAIQYSKEALNKDKQDSQALRVMSTILLVEGDLQNGLEYAEEAYSVSPDGNYIRDTYLVALYANGRNEEAQVIEKEITDLGQTLDDDTVRYLNGELTLKEFYVGE